MQLGMNYFQFRPALKLPLLLPKCISPKACNQAGIIAVKYLSVTRNNVISYNRTIIVAMNDAAIHLPTEVNQQ